jgi:hypothetical protein
MPANPEHTFPHFVALIRDANVRDGAYARASQAIVDAGETVRPVLTTLLFDPEKLVRDRAAELLRRLDRLDGQS